MLPSVESWLTSRSLKCRLGVLDLIIKVIRMQFNYLILKIKVILASLSFIGFLAIPALAATPSDAYQKAEHLEEIVNKLLESDLFEAGKGQVPAELSSRPRHVLRQATHVFEKVQLLRFLNGLPIQPAPEIKAREVKPDDVVMTLEAAIKSIQELGGIYKTDLVFNPPKVVKGKKPSDVMKRLLKLGKNLETLGAPSILPNDVYRIALSIKTQSEQLLTASGITTKTEADVVEKATPADALNEVLSLITDLEKMTKENDKFELSHGVVTPPIPVKGKPIKPSDVYLATQYVLADMYSLNVKLGMSEALRLPDAQSGRNPADVKNMIAQARVNIQALTQAALIN